jgi:phosphonate transport system ATP-binding protein
MNLIKPMKTTIDNKHAIEFNQVRISYPGAKDYALRIDKLSVNCADFVAVIGPSGAGKSTFLRSINGLIPHQQGELHVFGQSYRQRDLVRLRQQVSMVFQNFNLSPRMSVLDNVLIGRLAQKKGMLKALARFNDEDREIAFLALQKVGMLSYALRDIRQLSGGQKQRVAIARCLAQQAKIILADEPVASLDPVNARRIIELLKELNQEQYITVLVNLHQVELVEKYFSSVIGLKHGRLEFHQDSQQQTITKDWNRIYG